MVQSEVTPTIVAGVCDPGDPTTTGLTEAGYNACPIVARAEEPESHQKTSVFEPCLLNRRHLGRRIGASIAPGRSWRLALLTA
jgi:hypothetical protein